MFLLFVDRFVNLIEKAATILLVSHLDLLWFDVLNP